MTIAACERESEVARVLRAGHWPAACEEQLRAHVRNCRRCGEVVLVKTALEGMRMRDRHRARLQPPALLMWRAQLRRRHEALQRATKPIVRACVFALGLLAAALAGVVVTGVQRGRDWWAELGSRVASSFGPGLGWSSLAIGMLLAATLLLGGAAMYLAGDRD